MMELKEPRAKKQKRKDAAEDTSQTKVTGYFNGFSVVLEITKDAHTIVDFESFGKGSLSRGLPGYHEDVPIIRKRQFSRRKEWAQKFSCSKKTKKVIVVPDSDSENETYFQNLKPEFQLDSSGLEETINLTMTEAYFLLKYKKCLDIIHSNEIMSPEKCWETFRELDSYFVQDYICYHHFKSKNWVVKPALKFGGDYCKFIN